MIENIKTLMQKNQVNTKEIAMKLNVPEKNIHLILNEELPVIDSQIVTLCEVLNCTSDYLLGLSKVERNRKMKYIGSLNTTSKNNKSLKHPIISEDDLAMAIGLYNIVTEHGLTKKNSDSK